MRALANVIHSWPPYSEGYEQLSPELFTDFAEAGCSANEIAAWSGQSLRGVDDHAIMIKKLPRRRDRVGPPSRVRFHPNLTSSRHRQ